MHGISGEEDAKSIRSNAGHTESACAGALGIRLAGDTIYGSKVIKKPYIGDDKRAVLPEDICRCNYLMAMRLQFLER